MVHSNKEINIFVLENINMNFTTPVFVQPSSYPIDYNSKIITMGSCFSDSMGQKFSFYKFNIISNPFGVVFNPVSIQNLISRVIHTAFFTEENLVFHNDLWHTFEAHSDFSSTDKQLILSSLNNKIKHLNTYLKSATHLYITLGTAWVYVSKQNNQVVSNCHKLPQSNFDKKLLSVQEIVDSLHDILQQIQHFNPNCHVVFTVSPVRHIKDGFVENQRSKSHLITAIHEVIDSLDQYFPSFEIMMDELRDYRFYAQDMLHPSAFAIDIIWNKFLNTFINPNLYPILSEIENIQKALAHKPFNPDTESHQKFIKNTLSKIEKLQKKHPNIIFN